MTTTFRNYTGTKSVAMILEECCNCGVVFGWPRYLRDQRLRDGEDFYCPNGHPQSYTRKKELEQQLRDQQAETNRLAGQVRVAEAEARRVKTELTFTKGQLTKTRNRIHAGICPDCHRHFENVERHMACKHGQPNSQAGR
jgi:hypothetical protein